MSSDEHSNANILQRIEETVASHGFTDEDIKIESGSDTGDNYLGIINNITIQAKNQDGEACTLNWISKTASESEMYRAILNIPTVYAREMLFYEVVFPEFAKMQAELNIADPFASHPDYLHGSKTVPEMLIMENMKSRGFVMKNRVESLDYEHVKLVMEEYGRLHALSFALRELKPAVFKELSKEMKEDFFSKMDINAMKNSNDARHEKIERGLKDEDTVILEKFRNYQNNSLEKVVKLLNENDEYSVIGHGDSWVNNMLFKYENNSNTPSKLCLLDFQLSRYGSPAFDLSYFIYTCTDQTLRSEKFDEILEIYHSSLVSFLKKFGLDGERLLPYNVVHEQMKRYSVFGLMMASMVMHLMLSEKEEIPDLTKIKDLGDNNINYVSKNDHIYLKRLRDIIVDMAERDYI